MKGRVAFLAAIFLAIAGCTQQDDDRVQITLQRFFGACDAQFGTSTDPEAADDECGIITTLINKFNAENPDIHVRVNIAYWPGYEQLSAQLVTGDSPDLVTMHQSVITDFSSRNLIMPLDEVLRSAGIDPDHFTTTARDGVTRDGQLYALPFDNSMALWHLNLNLFRAANLMRDGMPLLPRSPEELLAHARQFKRATGKPYLVQSSHKEPSSNARNLFTFLMQQNATIFRDARHIDLQTPEARRVLTLLKQLQDEHLTTRNQDYGAAMSAFLKGEGGVYLVGTWMIGTLDRASQKPGSPLSGGYAVVPYPQLYPGQDVMYADGHAWAVPVRTRSPAQIHAISRVLGFLADHNYQWSRTGAFPVYRSVIESERWRAAPHRAGIAKLVDTGRSLPPGVQRRLVIERIVSESVESAITGQTSVDAALAEAEHRINALLANLLDSNDWIDASSQAVSQHR